MKPTWVVGLATVVLTIAMSTSVGAITIAIDDSTEAIKGTIDNANCQDVSSKTLEDIQCTGTVARADFARNQVFRIVVTEGAPDADPIVVSDRAFLSLADIAFSTDATLTFEYQSDVEGTPLPDLGGVPHIGEQAQIDLGAEFRKIQGFKAPDDFKITVKNDVPTPTTLWLVGAGTIGLIWWRRRSA
jgi:hypothetical protein